MEFYAPCQRSPGAGLFACGVAESSVGEGDNADGNQNDADNASRFHKASLQWAAALNQIDDQHDNGDNEQNMNEAAHGIRTNQSEQPEHEQDNEYCPQHKRVPSVEVLFYFVWHNASALKNSHKNRGD
jgi:hypothetical protein